LGTAIVTVSTNWYVFDFLCKARYNGLLNKARLEIRVQSNYPPESYCLRTVIDIRYGDVLLELR
jgi:hypothetical protein